MNWLVTVITKTDLVVVRSRPTIIYYKPCRRTVMSVRTCQLRCAAIWTTKAEMHLWKTTSIREDMAVQTIVLFRLRAAAKTADFNTHRILLLLLLCISMIKNHPRSPKLTSVTIYNYLPQSFSTDIVSCTTSRRRQAPPNLLSLGLSDTSTVWSPCPRLPSTGKLFQRMTHSHTVIDPVNRKSIIYKPSENCWTICEPKSKVEKRDGQSIVICL